MSYLLNLLQLRRNEVPRLGLAALLFFLIQVDDGIVKSVSLAVFNVRAGADKLPLMYTWIAVLFALSMVLLSWLTSRITRQRLLFGTMGGVMLVFALNTTILRLGEEGYSLPWLNDYYFLFISSELARTLMNFQIWIVAGGICYVSRAKIFFPLLISSAVLGDISGGFLVRILGSSFNSWQLFGLATLNMTVVLLVLRQLIRRYFVAQREDDQDEGAGLKENLRYLAGSRYLLLLFGLSLAIFAVYTTVHYGFNVVAHDYYESEAEVIEFFGLFFGLTGVATFLVTTFLLQRLLRWIGTGNIYLWVGVVYALIALMLVGVFVDFFANITGLVNILTRVFEPLLVIFLGNLVNYLLLDSIVVPTYQVMVKLIPARQSDGTRMIMEGGFILLGGLVGAGISSLHAHQIVTMGELFTLLFVLGGVMAMYGFMLKRSYTAELVKAVREQNIDIEDDQAMQTLNKLLANSPEFSRSLLLHRNDGVRQMGIEMLRQHPGPAVDTVCRELFEHENPRIRAAALAAFTPGKVGGDAATPVVLDRLDDEDDEVRLSAIQTLARLTDEMNLVDEDRIAICDMVSECLEAEGTGPEIQAESLVILEKLDHRESAKLRDQILTVLLNHQRTDALIAGIGAAGRVGASQFHERILECLSHAYPAVREATVHCLGSMGEQEGIEALTDMLADPDPDVVEAAIAILGEAEGVTAQMVEALSYRPLKEWQGLLAALIAQDDERLNDHLIASCNQRLVQASRYLLAIDRLEREQQPALQLLIDQLYLQNSLVHNGVVRILGYLGDVDVVGDLLERLDADEARVRESAIELLENIADRDLLVKLLPLLERDRERQLILAREVCGWSEIELDTVLNDLLHVSDLWTEMAAVWSALVLDRKDLVLAVAEDLTPEAGEILETIKSVRGMDEMTEVQPLTTMEKITFLKESPFFAALPLEELYHIALSMEEEGAGKGSAVIKEGEKGDKMYIVVNGELEVKKEDGPSLAILSEKQVFGEQALIDDEPRSASVVALADVSLLSLQRSSFQRLLRRYSSIAFNMMKILSDRLREAQAKMLYQRD